MSYYTEIIEILKEKSLSKKELNSLKIRLCKKYKQKKIPTDIEIMLHAQKSDLAKLKQLQTKPVRSLSGVSVIAVMGPPIACKHGVCIYCPGGPNSVYGDVPQSYTGKEPSTMRAIRANYDPYIIVFNRLEQQVVTGHEIDKAEIIIQGGTFPSFDKRFQNRFVTDIFKALNDFSELFFVKGDLKLDRFKLFFELPGGVKDDKRTKRIHAKLKKLKTIDVTKHSYQTILTYLENKTKLAVAKANLQTEQLRNETTKARCVGLTIETKPDWGLLAHGNQMLELGCTRVELGIQSVYDDVLKATNRGHDLKDSIESIQILKDLGFKLNFHYMPGLPLTDEKRDIEGMKELFSNANFRPDMLKIYPCMVMPQTPLERLYKEGKFKPISTKEAAERIVAFMPFVEPYCRIMRVQRDIPTFQTTAGVDKTNLRQYVDKLAKQKGVVSRCIRSREAGLSKKNAKKYHDYSI